MRVPATNPNGITSVSFSSQQGSNGGVTFNKVSNADTPPTPAVQYKPSETEAAAAAASYIYSSGVYHRASVLGTAEGTWKTVTQQMHKVEKAVQQERPDIANKSWDFSIKDGKIVVTGDGLTSDDKAWIEKKINGTKGLAEAAANFISLASSYLETSKMNPAYTGVSFVSGGQMEYNFHDTQKSLEKSVSFRALSKSLHQTFDTGHGRGDETIGSSAEYNAFNYLAATALTASKSD
jgi:hypothetical protein